MLTKEEIKEIKATKDDDLLLKFPNITRSCLRSIKNGTYKEPKIYILDIETSPIRALVWGKWEQNISDDQIENDWFVFCWSAKLLNSNKIISSRLNSKEAKAGDDKRIIKEMWKILDDADIVVAHNGDKFDIKKINTRLLINGIKYPSPYRSIDTLKIAHKEFSLTSNKLDYICRVLGIKRKLETGQKLWNACLKGDEKSLKLMSKYCENDVLILEEVYKKLTPYTRSNSRSWDIKRAE